MAEGVWMQMHPDDPSLADNARARLKKLAKSHVVVSVDDPASNVALDGHKGKAPNNVSQDMSDPSVDFKDTRSHTDDDYNDHDIFRWATLYENQRGLTLFSTPYYSSRSLLPHDPWPFTVPEPGPSSPSPHPHQSPPNVSPATYSLPDPTWRWVSKAWLVDMRGDGDVQHDGFEYNWFFRRAHWRPRVGWFSAGGFVRRRRWIRLMMRPSDARRKAEDAFDEGAHVDAVRPIHRATEPGVNVWQGDADDWSRVHAALKARTRDGPRLELWTDWLADLEGAPERVNRQAQTEGGFNSEAHPDTDLETYEHLSREWINAVLRSHLKEVYSLFVYPDSRAQLRDMFLRAGLGQDIFTGTPDASQPQLLGPRDFWSRTFELDLSENQNREFDQDNLV